MRPSNAWPRAAIAAAWAASRKPRELLDVRAENEAAALAGLEYDAAQTQRSKRVELALELLEHVRGQRVDRRTGLVERQPADGVVVDGPAPMFRAGSRVAHAAAWLRFSISKSQTSGR